MSYSDTRQQVEHYRREIAALRTKMRAAQATAEPEAVADYEFQTLTGPVRLSELFGRHRDLVVIHNMGASCAYCTLWGDGFNGISDHLTNRAAFAMASPDPPSVQRAFAESRKWKCRMVSHAATTFAADMGYRSEQGTWLPGVSVFRRTDDGLVRLSDTRFSPGDDFCALWHLFDLCPEGRAGWAPRVTYGESSDEPSGVHVR